MDEPLKTVVTEIAKHVVRLADGKEGKAIAIVDQVAELLLRETRRIVDEQKAKEKAR